MTEDTGPGAEPAAWLVRGGERGEREEAAFANELAIAGWENLGDISGCATREGIRQALNVAYPEAAANVIANWTGQVWRFREQISVSDLVVITRFKAYGTRHSP